MFAPTTIAVAWAPLAVRQPWTRLGHATGPIHFQHSILAARVAREGFLKRQALYGSQYVGRRVHLRTSHQHLNGKGQFCARYRQRLSHWRWGRQLDYTQAHASPSQQPEHLLHVWPTWAFSGEWLGWLVRSFVRFAFRGFAAGGQSNCPSHHAPVRREHHARLTHGPRVLASNLTFTRARPVLNGRELGSSAGQGTVILPRTDHSPAAVPGKMLLDLTHACKLLELRSPIPVYTLTTPAMAGLRLSSSSPMPQSALPTLLLHHP
jgi:hypothetical protein